MWRLEREPFRFFFRRQFGLCRRAAHRQIRADFAFAGNAIDRAGDFAFLVDDAQAVGDLTRAAAGADKALIETVRVFDVYRGQGVPEGMKSVALEVVIQPREATLTEAEIEALSAKIVVAVEKLGAKLRG